MDIRLSLKNLPSVERVLADERIAAHINRLSRSGITAIVRACIEAYREKLRSGDPAAGRSQEQMLERIVLAAAGEIEAVGTQRMRTVINATGVVLHTNLGRALLGGEAIAAVVAAATRCSDLEYDLDTGRRVERLRRVTRLLRHLTGAEDALAVNNNAAAVMLAVDTLASGGAVAVSRGELVEIGGSFRLPEILAKAAGAVIEVGTTNRTHAEDYERAIDEGATLLLKVHTSNYRVVGFTSEVPLAELTALGARRGVPVMYDQGSGVLYPLGEDGIAGEENIAEILARGVDLLSCSADKVLGGPQGGILLGRADLIERMRRNHLARALRLDKMTLAALEQVLIQYWKGELEGVPALEMILCPIGELRGRCELFASGLSAAVGKRATVEVVDGESSIGGGSFPSNPLPSVLVKVTLTSGTSARLAEALRRADPAVLVRVKGDVVYMDLRTVVEEEEPVLQARVAAGVGDLTGRE